MTRDYTEQLARVGLLPEDLSPLGRAATERAASVVFDIARARQRVSGSLAKTLDGGADLYLATADVEEEGPVDRCYWLTGLVRGDLLRNIAKTVSPPAMRDKLAGISKDHLAGLTSIYTEIDHLSLDEQVRRYVALERSTGLRWGLWVSSGGKSVHSYLALDEMVAPTDPAWGEAMALLCAIVEGDPALTGSPRRLMRLPGHVGRREQPILLLRDDSNGLERYSMYELRGRLRAEYERLGGTDVERSLTALRLAQRLANKGLDAELVACLRAERFAPSDDLLWTAEATLDGTLRGFFEMTFGPVGTVSVSRSGRRVLRVPEAVLAPYRGMRRGARIDPPCCAGEHRRVDAGELRSEPGESPRIWCHRCEHTVVGLREGHEDESEPAEAADRIDAFLATVADGLDVDPSIEPITDEERATIAARARARQVQAERFAEKLAKRKEAADAIDPALVEVSREVRTLAKEWTPRIRAKLKAEGLVRPTTPCGFTQGCVDAGSLSPAAVGRGCKQYACYYCGPYAIAVKVAAAFIGAVLDGEGRVIAGALSTRSVVHLYELSAAGYNAWNLRWGRAARAYAAANDGVESKERHLRLNSVVRPIWVSFHQGERIIVLSDLKLAPSRKGGGGAPVRELRGRGDVEATLLEVALSTYRVVRLGSDVEDVATGEPCDFGFDVVGRMRSSHGLSLDPDGILKLASEHSWVLEEAFVKPAREVAQAMTERGLNPRTSMDDDGNVRSVRSDPVENEQQRAELWAAVRTTPPQGAEEPDVEIDLDVPRTW